MNQEKITQKAENYFYKEIENNPGMQAPQSTLKDITNIIIQTIS